MKKLQKIFFGSAVMLVAGIALQGCSSETPFSSGGEGTLRINPEFRGDIITVTTRGAANYDRATLENNMVVYIENSKGHVIRKYKGFEELPTMVSLPTGAYVVEGWTGDSVSASFDKKFYRGYERVQIVEGNNSVSLMCNIANVLVSINTDALDDMLSDLKVTVSHSRGELIFQGETLSSTGYFMMPTGNDALHYKIEGKQSNGEDFFKEGDVEDVERAHNYQLVLKADASSITHGSAVIRLEILDIPVIDETVDVFPAPSFRAFTGANERIELADQVVSTTRDFNEVRLRILMYGGVKSLKLSFSDNFTGTEQVEGLNITEDAGGTALESMGISHIAQVSSDAKAGAEGTYMEVVEYWLIFSKEYLDALPVSDKEYVITFTALDNRGHTGSASLRIANSDNAVERKAPVGPAPLPDVNNEPLSLLATSVTLTGNIYSEDAADYGFMYRERGTTEWQKKAGEATRAGAVGQFKVVLTGLKPGTRYEYKAYADGYEDKTVSSFTTESPFTIPNASMEEWSKLSTNSKITIPGAGGSVSFWDSGNHGAATMSVTLTQSVESPKHSGNYAASLTSKFVGMMGIGRFAAGNLFVGSYDKTDGTDGELTFGRPYNGSHPSSLTVWANYRPGIADDKGSGSHIAQGDIDSGTIYVALTTDAVSVKTKSVQLFDKNGGDYVDNNGKSHHYDVVAYGEVIWDKSAFAADGTLEQVDITLKYNEAVAKTKKPTHLVLVCAASKYGDYFNGGEGSVLIVDDFKFNYGELEFAE